MKRSPKYQIVFVFWLVIPTAIFAAGDTESPSTDRIAPPGSYPIVAELAELWALVGANEASYLNSLDTTHMERLTNVRIRHTFRPIGEFSTTITRLHASNNLPDMIHYPLPPKDWANPYVATQGVAKSISSSINERTRWYAEVLQKWEHLKEVVTDSDGKVYMMPSFVTAHETPNTQFSSWSINRRWLDNLDLEVPTNADELLEVLTAFRQLDANGDGDPSDELPLAIRQIGPSLEPSMNRALPSSYADLVRLFSSRWISDTSGTIAPIFVRDQYREGLRFLRRACTEGLIDTHAIGGHAGVADTHAGLVFHTLTNSPGPDSALDTGFASYTATGDYLALSAVRDFGGLSFGYSTTFLPGPMFSSDDTFNRDIAIQYTDTFFAGFGRASNHRIEDIRLQPRVNGAPFYGGESYGMFLGDRFSFGGQLETYHLGPTSYSEDPSVNIQRDSVAQAIDQFIRLYFLPSGSLPSSYMWSLMLAGDLLPNLTNFAAINRFVDESIIQFACGSLDIDNDWVWYLERLSELGLEQTESGIARSYVPDTTNQNAAYAHGGFGPVITAPRETPQMWKHYLPRPTVSARVEASTFEPKGVTEIRMQELASAIASAINGGGYEGEMTYFSRPQGFLIVTDFEGFDCDSCERTDGRLSLRSMLDWVAGDADYEAGDGTVVRSLGEVLTVLSAKYIQARWSSLFPSRSTTADARECSRVIIFEADNGVEPVGYLSLFEATVRQGLKHLSELGVDSLAPHLTEVVFRGRDIRVSIYEFLRDDEDWDFIRNPPVGISESARADKQLLDFEIEG